MPLRRHRMSSADYREAVLAMNPVGYWRLGEAPGATVAVDEMGANNGTYMGSPTLGVAGALLGDANTGVTLANAKTVGFASSGALGDTFSIVAWVKRGSASQKVWWLRNTTGHEQLQFLADGRIYGTVLGSGQFCLSTTGLGTGTWQMVVVTKAAGPAKVYIDGVDRTAASSDYAIAGTPSVLSFGHVSTGLDGGMDEVALFGRALAAEIADLYRIGMGR